MSKKARRLAKAKAGKMQSLPKVPSNAQAHAVVRRWVFIIRNPPPFQLSSWDVTSHALY